MSSITQETNQIPAYTLVRSTHSANNNKIEDHEDVPIYTKTPRITENQGYYDSNEKLILYNELPIVKQQALISGPVELITKTKSGKIKNQTLIPYSFDHYRAFINGQIVVPNNKIKSSSSSSSITSSSSSSNNINKKSKRFSIFKSFKSRS